MLSHPNQKTSSLDAPGLAPQTHRLQGLYSLPDGRLAVVDLRLLTEREEAFFQDAQEAVSSWAGGIFRPAGVPFTIEIVREDPGDAGGKAAVADRLCAAAQELGAAALVVAAHRRGALAEALVGSVADLCAHRCEAPVVVLHAPGAESASAPTRWLTDALERFVGARAAPREEAPAAGGVVAAEDFSGEADGNLIGQAVGEFPGGELDLPAAGAAPSPAAATAATAGRIVVVCVDDSAASERACRWAAANLLSAPEDSLHLLRVVASLPSVFYAGGVNPGLSETYLSVIDPPVAAYKAAAEGFMERRFAAPLRAAGVRHVAEVVVEPVEDSVAGVGRAVCARAEALGAAAVVVGSHMRGGVSEAVLGSVASWVAHRCRAPVAVLH